MDALAKHEFAPYTEGNIMVRRWLIIFMLLLFAACQQQQEVVDIPTLAVLPSPTDTETPTNTPIPTWTDTPIPTDTPTITPSFTWTPSETPLPTNTPTDTFTPTYTDTLTETPTYTLTPLPTDTYTPRPTRTPRPTNTPSLTPTSIAQIITFGANLTSITPGSPVQLAWNAVADTVRIEQVNQDGVVTQTFPNLQPSGTISVAVPGNQGPVVQYRLVASRQGIEVSQSVPITVVCAAAWFFGNEFAPPGTGCPSSVGAIGQGAYQPFERGLMIYVNANGLNRIYGLQNDGARYISFVSGWDGTTIREDAAPSGLVMPQQMFNWAFYNTLAPVGSWNNSIGWATGNIDVGQRTIQWEGTIGGTSPFYIDAPGGMVFRFSGGDSGTWTRIR
jgi:hypothetical protein